MIQKKLNVDVVLVSSEAMIGSKKIEKSHTCICIRIYGSVHLDDSYIYEVNGHLSTLRKFTLLSFGPRLYPFYFIIFHKMEIILWCTVSKNCYFFSFFSVENCSS